MHGALLTWYRRNARDLPWRRTRDPYRIWMSEVMLQQTRARTVVPYFERWLERFPDVASLAAADEDEVLKLWEGLGYYRRARALYRAAQQVMAAGGALPTSAAGWRALPGIGPYTSHAIASIAHDEAVPVVDGNVERVLARVERIEAPVSDPATRRLFWRRAGELLTAGTGNDAIDPGGFNQAMMELGATVCTPRRPACLVCPLRDECRGREAGMAETLPTKPAKRVVPHADWIALLIVRGGRYLLAQRPPGLLGGLWEFPSTTRATGERREDAVRRWLAEGLGAAGEGSEVTARVDHAFTHLEVTIEFVRTRLDGPLGNGALATRRWVRRAELDDVALPVAMRKLARSIA